MQFPLTKQDQAREAKEYGESNSALREEERPRVRLSKTNFRQAHNLTGITVVGVVISLTAPKLSVVGDSARMLWYDNPFGGLISLQCKNVKAFFRAIAKIADSRPCVILTTVRVLLTFTLRRSDIYCPCLEHVKGSPLPIHFAYI